MTKNGNKAKGVKWIILFVVTGVVDLIQVIITFTGVGIFVSEALELVMPFFLIGVFQFLFKISMVSHPARLLSIIGATGLDAITGGVAPFWIVDVWYVRSSVKKEDAEFNTKQNQEEFMTESIQKPLYNEGRRNPIQPLDNAPSKPMNMDGIRAPNGGLRQ